MKTAQISFKAKPETVWNGDVKETWIKVPSKLTKRHCDMQAFRLHSKYGSYANSDLFPGMLNRIKEQFFGESYGEPQFIKLHKLPEGVSVDASGFLAVVTFSV